MTKITSKSVCFYLTANVYSIYSSTTFHMLCLHFAGKQATYWICRPLQALLPGRPDFSGKPPDNNRTKTGQQVDELLVECKM